MFPLLPIALGTRGLSDHVWVPLNTVIYGDPSPRSEVFMWVSWGEPWGGWGKHGRATALEVLNENSMAFNGLTSGWSNQLQDDIY
jgi:hypothetical protein